MREKSILTKVIVGIMMSIVIMVSIVGCAKQESEIKDDVNTENKGTVSDSDNADANENANVNEQEVIQSYFDFAVSLGSEKAMLTDDESGITFFQSTEELSTEDFLWAVYRGCKVGNTELKMKEQHLGKNEWDMDLYKYTVTVTELNTFTETILGRTFDYSNASSEHPFFGKYYYDAAQNSIVYDNSESGEGGGGFGLVYTYSDYVVEDNGDYVVNYVEYDMENETETGRKGKLILKETDGHFTIVSNEIH